MNILVQRVLGLNEAQGREKELRTYTISARSDHLDQIEKLFAWINMTRGGHSGAASIAIDGDGAARVTIEKKDGKLPKADSYDGHQEQKPVEFSVGLD